jgi:anti-sigma factor RsiW
VAKDYFKQIDEYVDGELTGSELSDFIKEMNRNPELSKEVELYKKVHGLLNEMADYRKKREDLNQLHEEYLKSKKDKQNPQTDK